MGGGGEGGKNWRVIKSRKDAQKVKFDVESMSDTEEVRGR